jgi:hypothetical protein
MTNKTDGVKRLVEDVLERHVHPPYGEDVIREVTEAIEQRPALMTRYRDLCDELTQHTVNKMIGRYTKQFTGMATIKQVYLTESGHIIGSYSKLKPRR